MQDCCRRPVDNLYVAGASVLPTGCEVNPQLTIKDLASFAAEVLLADAIPHGDGAAPPQLEPIEELPQAPYPPLPTLAPHQG